MVAKRRAVHAPRRGKTASRGCGGQRVLRDHRGRPGSSDTDRQSRSRPWRFFANSTLIDRAPRNASVIADPNWSSPSSAQRDVESLTRPTASQRKCSTVSADAARTRRAQHLKLTSAVSVP